MKPQSAHEIPEPLLNTVEENRYDYSLDMYEDGAGVDGASVDRAEYIGLKEYLVALRGYRAAEELKRLMTEGIDDYAGDRQQLAYHLELARDVYKAYPSLVVAETFPPELAQHLLSEDTPDDGKDAGNDEPSVTEQLPAWNSAKGAHRNLETLLREAPDSWLGQYIVFALDVIHGGGIKAIRESSGSLSSRFIEFFNAAADEAEYAGSNDYGTKLRIEA